MPKNWTGNSKSTYSTLGASNHSDHEREENDYYATDPKTVNALFEVEKFEGKIYECACGEGHLSKRMEELGATVFSSDLIDRSYGKGGVDFLKVNSIKPEYNIITNPPYKYAQDFVEHSLKLISEGKKVAMFLKLTFLEGQKRRKLFDKFPPKFVYVFSQRQKCAMNGDFKNTGSSAACYAWFIWEKGCTDDTIIKWI